MESVVFCMIVRWALVLWLFIALQRLLLCRFHFTGRVQFEISDCCTSFWLLMMPCAQGAFSLALNVFVVRMLRPLDIYLLIARGFARGNMGWLLRVIFFEIIELQLTATGLRPPRDSFALLASHRSTALLCSPTTARQLLLYSPATARQLLFRSLATARQFLLCLTDPMVDNVGEVQISDEVQQVSSEEGVSGSNKRKIELRSFVWKHFSKLPGGLRAKCHYCRRSYAAHSNSGTSGLSTHLDRCKVRKKMKAENDAKQ
ncbi:hypothetical protein WN943_014164 [Citrus x changshan-huyou]